MLIKMFTIAKLETRIVHKHNRHRVDQDCSQLQKDL